MKSKLNINIKSNKGFTMQDAAIAIIILILFAGTIGATYIAIYKMQAQTKVTSVATLYAIQILENIDKISYDEVQNGMEEQYRNTYEIPNGIGIVLEVSPNDSENTIKKIKLTVKYEISGKLQEIVFEKLKIKEL